MQDSIGQNQTNSVQTWLTSASSGRVCQMWENFGNKANSDRPEIVKVGPHIGVRLNCWTTLEQLADTFGAHRVRGGGALFGKCGEKTSGDALLHATIRLCTAADITNQKADMPPSPPASARHFTPQPIPTQSSDLCACARARPPRARASYKVLASQALEPPTTIDAETPAPMSPVGHAEAAAAGRRRNPAAFAACGGLRNATERDARRVLGATTPAKDSALALRRRNNPPSLGFGTWTKLRCEGPRPRMGEAKLGAVSAKRWEASSLGTPSPNTQKVMRKGVEASAARGHQASGRERYISNIEGVRFRIVDAQLQLHRGGLRNITSTPPEQFAVMVRRIRWTFA